MGFLSTLFRACCCYCLARAANCMLLLRLGVIATAQASEMEDITEKDINDAVISVLTRK